jgi:hypothetical protein
MVGLGGLEPPTSPLSVFAVEGPAPSRYPCHLSFVDRGYSAFYIRTRASNLPVEKKMAR